MKKEQRASENTGWRRRPKGGCIQVFDIGCPVPHEGCIHVGCLAISVESLGNTIPSINAQKNKKSVGLVNRKLAD